MAMQSVLIVSQDQGDRPSSSLTNTGKLAATGLLPVASKLVTADRQIGPEIMDCDYVTSLVITGVFTNMLRRYSHERLHYPCKDWHRVDQLWPAT